MHETREPAVLEGVHCRYAISRPAPHIVLVAISGSDIGEFGDAPMRELDKHVARAGRFDLFIDARAVKGASMEVSHEWSKWLSANRAHLEHVNMLTGNRYIEMTAGFVRRFA